MIFPNLLFNNIINDPNFEFVFISRTLFYIKKCQLKSNYLIINVNVTSKCIEKGFIFLNFIHYSI